MPPAPTCWKAAPTRRSIRALQHAREQEIFGAKTPFYGWHYPPFFLFVAAPLALMPYRLALVVWQAVTLVLYLLADPRDRLARHRLRPQAAMRRADPRLGGGTDGSSSPLAFPAVFVNLGHGHNGFLTAALIGFALLLLDRRPILAGILFGLLAYKPQFGLMIPLVLIATGRWRTLFAAAATVARARARGDARVRHRGLARVLRLRRHSRARSCSNTATPAGTRSRACSPGCACGAAPVPLAYAVQGAVTLGARGRAGLAVAHARRFALKAAALCLAAILATPYSLDYDLMVLAPAIAFLAVDGLRRGFAPYEKQRARVPLARAADRAQRRAGDVDPARRHRDAAMFVLVLQRARSDFATARDAGAGRMTWCRAGRFALVSRQRTALGAADLEEPP